MDYGRQSEAQSLVVQQSIDEKFGIVSVKPVDAPSGAVGTDWHCYVIEQGKNNIRGYRQGSIDTVTRAVEEIVVRLNERRRGRFGRVHLTMSSHGNKDKRQ
jgi:hypothetical protein